MGRWVTTGKGRKFYIPDEGEENPYAKQIDKEIADKERQMKANQDQATEKNRESFVVNSDLQKLLDRKDKNKEKYKKQRAKRTQTVRSMAMESMRSEMRGNRPKE